jgi:sugar phosphate permease
MYHRRWTIFGICASLFLMSLFYRASSAIIAPDLVADLNLSPHALGFMGAAFFYSFAIVQLPLGLFLDRVGPRITMAALNFMGAAGAVIFAHAGGMAGGVTGRAMLGLGMAANFMGPLKLLTSWFDPRKFATLSGLLLSLGTVGSLAATTPLAVLVEWLGWRNSFYFLGGLNAFLAIWVLIIIRDMPSDKPRHHTIDREKCGLSSIPTYLKTLFSNWNYWAISLSTFFRYGSYAAIQSLWAGPFLMEYLKLSPVSAGNLLFMLSFGFILGSPFGGFVSDRFLRSRKKTIVVGIFLSAIATLAFSQWRGSAYLLWLGSLLFALGFFNSFGQVMYAHIKDLMPDEMSGTAMAGINFFTMMGAGVFIHLLGGIMENMSSGAPAGGEVYRISFLLCFGALLVSVAVYMTTRDSAISAKSIRNK